MRYVGRSEGQTLTITIYVKAKALNFFAQQFNDA